MFLPKTREEEEQQKVKFIHFWKSNLCLNVFSKKPKNQGMSNAELSTLASIFPGLCDNMDVQLPNIPSSSDDICAALSSFVEKNKQSTIDENTLTALLSVPNCKLKF